MQYKVKTSLRATSILILMNIFLNIKITFNTHKNINNTVLSLKSATLKTTNA